MRELPGFVNDCDTTQADADDVRCCWDGWTKKKKKKKIPKWALLTPAPPAHLGVCNETSTLASSVPREYTHTDKRRPIFSNICRLGWERTNVKVPGQELWPVSKAISGTRCVVMFRSRVPGETRNLFFFFSCFIYSFFSPFSFSTAKRSTLRPFLTLIFFIFFVHQVWKTWVSEENKAGKKKRESSSSPPSWLDCCAASRTLETRILNGLFHLTDNQVPRKHGPFGFNRTRGGEEHTKGPNFFRKKQKQK